MAKKAKFGARFLDPATVGSSIRWVVGGEDGTQVSLTDCHRTITWSGWNSDGKALMKKKVSAAVDELNKFLAALEAS